MYHEDGIEVYLKPGGEGTKNVKFAEFPVLEFNREALTDEHLNRRCVIHAQDGKVFQVVIRLRPEFDMFAASAISLYCDVGDELPSPHPYRVVQRSLAYEQHIMRSTASTRTRSMGRSSMENSSARFSIWNIRN